MKKKNFKTWSFIWAIVWAVFAFIAYYFQIGLGNVATLGGIALMFAWMYEQANLKD